jgi:hypothetical protein
LERGGGDDLFVVGVCELRAPLGSQCQEKKGQLQKSELEHDSLPLKAYTTTPRHLSGVNRPLP